MLDINSKGQGNRFLSDIFRLFADVVCTGIAKKKEFYMSNWKFLMMDENKYFLLGQEP